MCIVVDNIAANWAILTCIDAVRIVYRSRHIVDDRDHDICGRAVTIAVCHNNFERIAIRIGQRVVGQRVLVSVLAIIFSYDQLTFVSRDGAAIGNVHAIDHQRTDGVIAGIDEDRTASSFAV